MTVLNDLLANEVEKRELEDFVRRYEEGSPDEGYTNEEAWNRYRQVTDKLSPEEYREAVEGAVGRLSSGQRLSLAKQLKEQGAGKVLPELEQADDDQLEKPEFLVSAIMKMRQYEPHFLSAALRSGAWDDRAASPGLLERIFGSSTGAARAVLGGIAALSVKKALDR